MAWSGPWLPAAQWKKIAPLLPNAPQHTHEAMRGEYHGMVSRETLESARKAREAFRLKWRKLCPGAVVPNFQTRFSCTHALQWPTRPDAGNAQLRASPTLLNELAARGISTRGRAQSANVKRLLATITEREQSSQADQQKKQCPRLRRFDIQRGESIKGNSVFPEKEC